MAKPFPCPKCDGGTVIPQAKDGRFMYYRNVMVNLPRKLLLPRCLNCQRDFMDDTVHKSLDVLLEASYKLHLTVIKAAEKRLKKALGTN